MKFAYTKEVHSIFIEDKNTRLSPTANEDAFLKEEGYEDLGAEDRSVLNVHSLAQQSKASISATPKTKPVPNSRLLQFSVEVEFPKRSIFKGTVSFPTKGANHLTLFK